MLYLTSLRIIRSTTGSAAMEMALVTPLLLTLLFGSCELGNYFLSEHVVAKAVRDGARYASRLNFQNYPCDAASTNNVPLDPVQANTQNIVRTQQLAADGTPRLPHWTNASTIIVTYDCVTNSGSIYSGVYKGLSYVPTVKVTAQVPYNSLFKAFGFTSATLLLNAHSQAAVMGL